ncbi:MULTISPECIES: Yip1 family protein [Methylovorus]|jgi:hypothetical protein|uniref:Yip1 family protein n=1 Tax=Methylovorus TaxID=81682 RepID=UPI0001EC46E3|nr:MULTISPECIES: Yip1 family protein [Methylovorus]ADQ84453.1 conserved hypothetical protein [Methylovorus sp. MP688]KAF0844133.1 uncharacterized protein DUF1282 [Methylovorus glucosotrophus]
MHPLTLFKLFFAPVAGWQSLLQGQPSIHRLYLLHVIPFSLIPAAMLYIAGSAHSFAFLELMPGNKLLLVSIAFFIVQLVVVPIMASIVRQLAEVADIHPTYRESFILAAVAPTPLWMAPIFLLVPDIYVNLAIASLAMMASAGFIYFGIPTIFNIRDSGQSALFFGAVFMAGVIAWGFLMICTLVVWGSIQNLLVN